MATPGIGNLSTLIKRLEAATSRLEDLAQTQGETSGGIGAVLAAGAIGAAGGSASGAASAPAATPSAPLSAVEELPPAVEKWDEDVIPALLSFTSLSTQIGGLVGEQSKSVIESFEVQRNIILLAAKCKKPADGGLQGPTFAKILEPLRNALVKTQEVKEKNRAEKKLFNHLSAIAEGIPAVGWVAIEPKPAPYVGEMKDSAQFYLNRVIKDFKDTDKTHVEWSRAFVKLLDALQQYVKDKHTVGLMWNPKGSDAASFSASSKAEPSAAGGPAPPPPPPPAPPIGVGTNAGAPAAAGGMGAVFGELNKGEGITQGLRKVDRSEMTHKNPELRGSAQPLSPSGSSKVAGGAPPKIPSKPVSLRAKKPAKTALEGNKWMVENHEDEKGIVIDQTELSQTVNIFGCKNCVIQVKGKVNAVSLISCTKTSVLLDTLVSSLSITSSPSFTVQVTGRTPTVLIDTTDSGQLYLSKESLNAEVVTAKCSAINISVPLKGGEEGEFVEHAMPEQLKHVFDEKSGKFKTEIVAHSG